MSELQELKDALDRLEAWDENVLTVQIVMVLGVAVKTARRVANGIGKAAIELVDSDGNHQWVVTVLVDGPGDYTLLYPKEDNK